MKNLNLIKFIILIMIISAIVYFVFKQNLQNKSKPQLPPATLQIISTSPSPLEGATILPTQTIEITLSKPVVKSEFKYKLEPEAEHDIQVEGNIIKIVFTKPLPLGQGFTLFILSSTHTENGLNLGEDKIYHFKTIKYTGV